MKKRVNPMPAKRIKIVSYWSGIAKANGSGEANFEFDIPQFSGEVRLMAVAYKGQSFGSSENTMTVADPIVISTALPRFLSPGDTVTVPVTLSNTTSKATNVSANLKVSGPLKIIGSNNQSLSLNANSENRAIFQVVADPAIAVGKIISCSEWSWVKNSLTKQKYLSAAFYFTKNVLAVDLLEVAAHNRLLSGSSDFIPGSIRLSSSGQPLTCIGIGRAFALSGCISLWLHRTNCICRISAIILWRYGRPDGIESKAE